MKYKIPVGMEFGTPKLSQPLAELLALVKAKESTRYALNCIGVKNGVLTATNGRQLLMMEIQRGFEIEDGAYHLTGEGFLLKNDEVSKFPKLDDVIPSDGDLVQFPDDTAFYLEGCSSQGYTRQTISKAIAALCLAKFPIDFFQLSEVLMRMRGCGINEIKLYKLNTEDYLTRPLVIKAEVSAAKFTYLQMPFVKQG